MPKGYRKVRAIPGTIFDPSNYDDGVKVQRRCGFFYLHKVNPATVARGSASVESLGDGKVRVYYDAIYLPEGESQWDAHGGVPSGVWCEHGGYKKRHKVKNIRHIDANLSEVL